MSTETWYVLEDGSAGDPRCVRRGADGVLRHKDGRAVAYAPHGPRSRSVDPDAERAKAVATPEDVASEFPTLESSRDIVASDDREMKPGGGRKRYRTR